LKGRLKNAFLGWNMVAYWFYNFKTRFNIPRKDSTNAGQSNEVETFWTLLLEHLWLHLLELAEAIMSMWRSTVCASEPEDFQLKRPRMITSVQKEGNCNLEGELCKNIESLRTIHGLGNINTIEEETKYCRLV